MINFLDALSKDITEEDPRKELRDEILILPNRKLSQFFFKEIDLVDFNGEISCLLCSVPPEFTDENIKGLLRVRNIGGKTKFGFYFFFIKRNHEIKKCINFK